MIAEELARQSNPGVYWLSASIRAYPPMDRPHRPQGMR